MKQTCERCYNIQNKFREYKKKSDQRLAILYQVFEKEHKRLKAVAKAKKAAKRPKEIPRMIKDSVIHRYFRYCKDQHFEIFNAWREKVAGLHKNLQLGIQLRRTVFLHMLQTKQTIMLINPEDDALILDKDALGAPYTDIVPCLDPDLPDSDKIDEEIMS